MTRHDDDVDLGRPGLRGLLLEVAAAAFLALVLLTPLVSLALIAWYAVPKEAGQSIGVLGAIVVVVVTAIGWRR